MDPGRWVSLKRLTDASHWEAANSRPDVEIEPKPRGTAHRLIARIFGPERMKLLTQQVYSEYEFWNVLLPRWIVPDSQKSVLEVGSAPGVHLVEFHRLFGYR